MSAMSPARPSEDTQHLGPARAGGVHPLDALTLPLRSWQVIEASAGTGKTWTLAALYLRLVLGHGPGRSDAAGVPGTGLLPPQILVMTFTTAATAELRERIRTRLSQAARCFDAHARSHDAPVDLDEDAFTQQLRLDIPRERWAWCALQLHAAADWMDDAAIHTIHGWSQRMLTQHALASGQAFAQRHLEDGDTLLLHTVQDYWRTWFYPQTPATLAAWKKCIGSGPADWLQKLRERWRLWDRQPGAVPVPHDTPHTLATDLTPWLAEHAETVAAARAAWSPAVRDALQTQPIPLAQQTRYQTSYPQWLADLHAWAVGENDDDPVLLKRFSAGKLAKWPPLAQHDFFARLDAVVASLDARPDADAALLDHAAYSVRVAYQQAKAERNAFDFQDLLRALHDALARDDGTLAQAIRAQYPVALVDEFQDTDPWQYESLRRIYPPGEADAATRGATDSTTRGTLVMIGDPKQAIYGFRGADLGTYLRARAEALAHDPQALHTLTVNHRSSEGLLRAVAHVFTRPAHPFHLNAEHAAQRIDFVPVSAAGRVTGWTRDGQAAPAMTVWRLPSDKPLRQDTHLAQMAEVFASQMTQLLNSRAATPGEMAVLVRSARQARVMQAALRARGVASVYLSDGSSVYASAEALDLWRLLVALANPRDPGAVRAALASRLWSLPLAEVQALLDDETRWEQLLMRCHDWQARWQRQGVQAMLYHWLHAEGVAQRLLAEADGERRLSHLLHLAELLQHAAPRLQGLQALTQWLAEQIAQPPLDAEAQKMRLETDAACVQIITYHKSKGLQYPLVFLPFLGSFTYEKDDEENGSSVEEDLRLIYVALTRAERALWLGVAEVGKALLKGGKGKGALAHLLLREDLGDLAQQVAKHWGDCPDIQVEVAPEPDLRPYQADATDGATQNALTPTRRHLRRWWTASFSALTRDLHADSAGHADEGDDAGLLDALVDAAQGDADLDLSLDTERDANAEIGGTRVTAEGATATAAAHQPPPNTWQDFPAGARYGVLLHDLLQWQAEQGWPIAHASDDDRATDAAMARTWERLLALKAQSTQLDAAATDQITPWLRRIARAALPLDTDTPPLRLQDLSAAPSSQPSAWAEMAFTVPVVQAEASQLDALVRQHLLPGQPRPALQARQLHGMLTGFMDLVFEHDGRYWVLDYKSNRLPDYRDATLTRAILAARYEVQYTLYTLALHRLLKARLPDYDYARHIGGAVYLFLRGIDAPHRGVHTMRLPQALIEALDAWLGTPGEASHAPRAPADTQAQVNAGTAGTATAAPQATGGDA